MTPKRPSNPSRTALTRSTSQQSANAIELRDEFYQSVSDAVRNARGKVYRAINATMVDTYWNLGRMILEEEQHGKGRAQYGAALLQTLATRLMQEFGQGFDESNLRNFRQFFVMFPSDPIATHCVAN